MSDAPGYYGLPALKASHWRWMVAIYIFIAGLAGSLQALALLWLAAADGSELPTLVGHARYIALLCAVAGSALLIADLKTPRRWYQMLRIFRSTSPMSIGSYVLVGFSALTALLALMQAAGDLALFHAPAWLQLAVQAPCAVLGLLMASYTAPLLSATSTPLWAASPKLLAGSFASFAVASGAGMLMLTLSLLSGDAGFKQPLLRIAFISELAALLFVLAWTIGVARQDLAAPLWHGQVGMLMVVGVLVVGLALPLALHVLALATGSAANWLSLTAAAGELVGSLSWRAVVLMAGHESARRPADYLRMASASRVASPSGKSHPVGRL